MSKKRPQSPVPRMVDDEKDEYDRTIKPNVIREECCYVVNINSKNELDE